MKIPGDDDCWAAQKVRHFRRLLYGVTAVFLATELTALTGLVPRLSPVSFHVITANILFAIGFGCPLVLYLSSLPRLREVAGTMAAGLLLAAPLWKLQQWIGLPPALNPQEVAAAQVITGLGLASLGTLSLRAWRRRGSE